MQKRPGFTLAELILAVLIFSFMMTSLATIYSTSSRNMFQNYRGDVIKTNVGVAMRAVHNNLAVATRIDAPAAGDAGDILDFATNVDQITGCYPVYNDPLKVNDDPAWHHFCIGPDPDPVLAAQGVRDLFYHTAPITGGTGCSSVAPTTWGGVYPVPAGSCGQALGGPTVLLLMQFASPNPVFFSRRPTETVLVNGVAKVTQGVNEADTVRVMLRSWWRPLVRGFGKSQRDVDFTMDTVIKVNRPAWLP